MRPLALGALVAAGLAGLVQGVGAVGHGSGGYLWAGVGMAMVAGMLTTALHAQVTRRAHPDEASPRFAAQRLQALLGLAFAIKLLFAATGALGLWALGVKFPQLATFALAFAAASLILQGAVAAGFARLLADRARAGGAAATAHHPS